MLSRLLLALLATSPTLNLSGHRTQTNYASYVRLPGSSGNYASTPDSAAVSITNNVDIRVKAALTDWTTGSAQVLLAKWQSSGAGLSYALRISATGFPNVLASSDGSATSFNQTSSAILPYNDGSTGWLRVTVESNGTNATAKFYTSSDGDTWSQLGTDKTAALTGIFDGTSIVEIGSQAGGTNSVAAGRIFYAEIRSSVGGTVVARFNPPRTHIGDTTWTATTGEVWTLNGTAILR